MNFYKLLNIFVTMVFLNLSFSINVIAFGVEGAMAEEEGSVVVADNNVVKKEDVDKESPLAAMESKHIGNPESIEAGRAKYGNTCLFCHGAKGVGARAPTLVAGGFAPGGVLDNNHYLITLKYGRPGTIMGSYEGILTEDEMWQVIAYLRDQSEKVAAAK